MEGGVVCSVVCVLVGAPCLPAAFILCLTLVHPSYTRRTSSRAKFLRDNVPIARKYVEQDELRLQSEAAEKAARAKEVSD